MLATVYWSLGAILLVVSIIVGFGWFTNFKIYQRDLEMLRAENKDFITRTTREIRQQLMASLQGMSSDTEMKLGLRVESLSRELKLVEHEFVREQYKSRIEEGYSGLAMMQAIKLMEISLAIGFKSTVADSLQLFLDCPETTLNLMQLNRVHELLESVPPEHEIMKRRAKEKVEAMKIESW